ncbi:MAG: molybdenum cofactor guanylyltransferase, partial [Candidatus Odinarchaeota archaeon]
MRSLVINSGGESKRLKEFTDLSLGKAWLKVQGKPLLIQNIESLQGSVEEISIIVRNINQAYRFEAELDRYSHLIETEKVHVVTERQENIPPGPIRGIISGIQSSRKDIVWFMPCDHPFLTPEIFEKLESHLMEQSMVTLQHDAIGFEPQIFVSDLKTLKYFSTFVNELPVDLFRLVPNSLFLPVTDKKDLLALLGVNTPTQLETLLNHALKKENTIKTGGNKL